MPIDDKKREYNRKYYESHRKKLIKDACKYSKKHRAEINTRNKQWRDEHPEEARAKGYKNYLQHKASNPRWHKRRSKRHSREWRAEHPEYQKEWREKQGDAHRKYMSEYMRQWRKEHPILTKRHMKKSYINNPAAFKEGAWRRRARMNNATGSHRYSEWLELLSKHDFKCFYCKKEITVKTATRDHMQPISRGGSDGIENIAPACRFCNGSKHSKTAEEYMLYLSSSTNKWILPAKLTS